MKKKLPVDKKKSQEKKIKLAIFAILGIILLIKLSKGLFFIIIFTYITYMGKQIRGAYGLKMVVLDPLIFCSVLLATYVDLKSAVIFILLNTIIIDFITNIASEGTFFNFVFFSIGTLVGVGLFSNLGLMISGTISAFLYSLMYWSFRTFVIPNPPHEVISKVVTSFMFTFFYLTMLGPLFNLIMSI
jgi:hypothetical protein